MNEIEGLKKQLELLEKRVEALERHTARKIINNTFIIYDKEGRIYEEISLPDFDRLIKKALKETTK